MQLQANCANALSPKPQLYHCTHTSVIWVDIMYKTATTSGIASAQITCSCSSTITTARNTAIRALSSWVPMVTDPFGAPVFGAPVLRASDFGDSDLGHSMFEFSCIIRNIPSLLPRHYKRIYPAYEAIRSKNTGTYTYIHTIHITIVQSYTTNSTYNFSTDSDSQAIVVQTACTCANKVSPLTLSYTTIYISCTAAIIYDHKRRPTYECNQPTLWWNNSALCIMVLALYLFAHAPGSLGNPHTTPKHFVYLNPPQTGGTTVPQ